MKNSCFRWIFFPSGDYLGLRRRLNRLAESGWELKQEGDGSRILARFQRTERTELRYDVETAPFFRDAGQLEQTVERRRQAGWEPVGTINGVDIYASMPCREPQEENDRMKNRRAWLPRGVISLLLIGLAIVISWNWHFFSGSWYLGNVSALLYGGRFPLLAGGAFWAAWVIWRLIDPGEKPPRPALFWLRTGLLAGFLLWVLLLLVSVVLDCLPLVWGCAVLGLTAAGYFLARWSWKQRTGQISRSVLILVLGCGLIATLLLRVGLPDDQRYSVGSAPWRYELSDIVRAEELGRGEAEFLSAEYDRGGSLLVRKSSYQEEWEDFRLECEYYSCLTPGLAALAERDMTEKHPDFQVVRQGRSVVALWTSEEIPAEKVEAILSKKWYKIKFRP